MSDKYSLQVILPSANSDRWSPVSTYGKNGLTYVYGKPDKVFRLKFSNHTASKVLAVPTIDGLSTVDGKPCDAARSPGYVVAAYSSVEIKGWSINNDESAAFVFKDKAASYVANSATPEGDVNCGVIGCLVYAEALPPQPVVVTQTFHYHQLMPEPQYTWTYCGPPYCGSWGSASNSNDLASQIVNEAKSRSAETPDFVLGTGWGDNQVDRTSSVEFKRGELLEAITLHYTSLEKLVEAGIDVNKNQRPKVSVPQAFGGFCVPPRKK